MRTRELIIYKAQKLPEYLFKKEKEHCLIFLHLGKTGGTTLTDIIQRNYNPWRTLNLLVPTDRDSNGKPKSFQNTLHLDKTQFGIKLNNLKGLDCVTGHLPYGLHKFIPKPCQYISMIRNPLTHVWSRFNHAINRKHHYLYHYLEKYDFKLSRVLDSGEVFEFSNHQSRALLGSNKVSIEESDVPGLLQHIDQNFTYIGITEAFDQSLSELKDLLCWQNTVYKRKNTGTYTRINHTPDKDDIEAIYETSKIDRALYQHVKSKTKRIKQ